MDRSDNSLREIADLLVRRLGEHNRKIIESQLAGCIESMAGPNLSVYNLYKIERMMTALIRQAAEPQGTPKPAPSRSPNRQQSTKTQPNVFSLSKDHDPRLRNSGVSSGVVRQTSCEKQENVPWEYYERRIVPNEFSTETKLESHGLSPAPNYFGRFNPDHSLLHLQKEMEEATAAQNLQHYGFDHSTNNLNGTLANASVLEGPELHETTCFQIDERAREHDEDKRLGQRSFQILANLKNENSCNLGGGVGSFGLKKSEPAKGLQRTPTITAKAEDAVPKISNSTTDSDTRDRVQSGDPEGVDRITSLPVLDDFNFASALPLHRPKKDAEIATDPLPDPADISADVKTEEAPKPRKTLRQIPKFDISTQANLDEEFKEMGCQAYIPTTRDTVIQTDFKEVDPKSDIDNDDRHKNCQTDFQVAEFAPKPKEVPAPPEPSTRHSQNMAEDRYKRRSSEHSPEANFRRQSMLNQIEPPKELVAVEIANALWNEPLATPNQTSMPLNEFLEHVEREHADRQEFMNRQQSLPGMSSSGRIGSLGSTPARSSLKTVGLSSQSTGSYPIKRSSSQGLKGVPQARHSEPTIGHPKVVGRPGYSRAAPQQLPSSRLNRSAAAPANDSSRQKYSRLVKIKGSYSSLMTPKQDLQMEVKKSLKLKAYADIQKYVPHNDEDRHKCFCNDPKAHFARKSLAEISEINYAALEDQKPMFKQAPKSKYAQDTLRRKEEPESNLPRLSRHATSNSKSKMEYYKDGAEDDYDGPRDWQDFEVLRERYRTGSGNGSGQDKSKEDLHDQGPEPANIDFNRPLMAEDTQSMDNQRRSYMPPMDEIEEENEGNCGSDNEGDDTRAIRYQTQPVERLDTERLGKGQSQNQYYDPRRVHSSRGVDPQDTLPKPSLQESPDKHKLGSSSRLTKDLLKAVSKKGEVSLKHQRVIKTNPDRNKSGIGQSSATSHKIGVQRTKSLRSAVSSLLGAL